MEETEEQKVPYARFAKAVEARKEIEAELKTARARIAELEPVAEKVTTLESTLAEEKAARAADVARYEAREAFVTRGIDDADTMDILRSRWDKLPKKDRPELGQWLDEGAAEDKIAARLLPAKEAPPAEASEAPAAEETPAEKPEPRATRTHAGSEPPPPPATPMTREQYQKRLASAKTPQEVQEAMRLRFGE